jgi:GNAT superfamily N-acetyltransferase
MKVLPLTPARWDDFVELFGANGACGGCWCQVWRKSRKDYVAGSGAGNRRSMHRLVKLGPPPGLLGYQAGQAIAWLALAPRSAYVALERSRVLALVDQQPVWSVSCFFVRKDWRGKRVAVSMLEAACSWARKQGAQILEGYPIDTRGKRQAPPFVWTGLVGSYRAAGFEEVARRTPTRPIMRNPLSGSTNGA